MYDNLITPAPSQPEIPQSPIEPASQPFPEAPVTPITNQAPKPKRSKKPLLLLLLVILLIAGAGYGVYAWQHKKVNDLNTQISSLQSQITDFSNQINSLKSSSSNSSATTTTTPKNLIKITKLGIEFSAPDSLKDLIYSVFSQSPINGHKSTSVGLSTQALADADKGCLAANAPLGVLSKTDGQYPANANVENSSGELIKQYPTYYIGRKSSQFACSSNAKVMEAENTDVAALGNLKWAAIIQQIQ